jgi:hypothetical protein
MLKNLYGKWKNRRKNQIKYSSFDDFPIGVNAFLFAYGSLGAWGFGYPLAKVMPVYLETANSIPLGSWGWKGWYLTFLLAVSVPATWLCSLLARRCGDILYKRIFP